MPRIVPRIVLAAALIGALPSGAALAQGNCPYPPAVCAARASVFAIASYDPMASAVRIGERLLVTNRHAVADETAVTVTRADGSEVKGTVVPSSYEGDLILVEADLGDGPVARLDDDADPGPYQTVGADISERAVMVYAPGGLLASADAASHSFARLHVAAYAQPGNSGGALIDGEGELVGIIASGGEGRTEAVPVQALEQLRAASGPGHAGRSAEIGTAYRQCDFALEKARQVGGALPEQLSATLLEACTASRNRQLIDLAAQAFGSRGELETSARLFEMALARDPAAINTRLGYLTTLHLAGRFADELPILRELVKTIPQDPQVQRFAIQAGKWGGDEELARKGLELVERHNPAQAAAARRFFEADIPPPRRVPRAR